MIRPIFSNLLTALILAVFVPLGPAAAEEITIATYNIENSFDVFDNPYTADEGTPVKSRQELKRLAATIESVDADVIVFQEIENGHLLRAMVTEFLPDAGYIEVFTQLTNDERGINLGVMSRLPVHSVTSHRFQNLTHPDAPGEVWRFARDLMRIELDAGLDEPIVVYNVHFKANGDSPGDPNSMRWRTAEALRVRRIVERELAEDPDFLAVVAGDFNSAYETRPEQPRPWPAMRALMADDDSDSSPFMDLHKNLSDQQRVTLPGDGQYPPVTFDYILATPAMARRLVPGSARMHKITHDASDHLPVLAIFAFD